jgi:surfactin synthase thioesterase subunit
MAIYGGQSDVHAPPAEMREWARHTTGPATVTLFDGGHFFYRDSAQSAVLRDLSQRLETWRT